jgi:lipopolysaccharide/colanic/teichoic acid biosynthesis glycosyltransferase
MTRVYRTNPQLSTRTEQLPTLWGFGAHELHDAYWRSHGIQCVRRAEAFTPQKGRDLFMLVEPRQCALFDHAVLANSLSWNRAPLSRIKVFPTSQPYRERVIENDKGDLLRIDRDYRNLKSRSTRVLMTRRASVAQIWSESENRRKAWTDLRRFVDWTRTDHYSIEGYTSTCGTSDTARELITELTKIWSEPDLVLNGLVQIRPGIWGIPGTDIDQVDHLLPPVWVGRNAHMKSRSVVIGPTIIEDDTETNAQVPSGLKMLEIDEILRSSNREASQEADEISLYSLTKRSIDVVISLCVILILLPLIMVVGISVMVNDGRPVFFGHVRQSRGGRNFKCWKFRTMLRNAESMVGDLSEKNIADGPQVFIKNDPRITKVGRLLRRFHIDEMPQFWNVLVGDMSLVGPRPSPEKENQFCPAWRDARLSVRPGITGLWQVERTRAPGMDFQEWIKYDIEYVNRASLLLDARICFKTLYRMVRG